jgi:hypothetical protein
VRDTTATHDWIRSTAPTTRGRLEGLQVTIDPRERVNLHRQLLQEQMGDVALMPLYWELAPSSW